MHISKSQKQTETDQIQFICKLPPGRECSQRLSSRLHTPRVKSKLIENETNKELLDIKDIQDNFRYRDLFYKQYRDI